ncbi:MAG: type II secretion system protein [Synergistaceae bacterium]|nr:type II secretion system protein [Synergistaceae bacterium]
MKNFSKRRGFTLVELLIVIVVIGVLSAMMMLSSTEAVSSAKASNIVSGLRNFKTAILSWYADNLDRVKKRSDNKYGIDGDYISTFVKDKKGDAEFLKYLNSGEAISLKQKSEATTVGDYTIIGANLSKKWYICYYVGKKGTNTSVKEKLTSRAVTAGLSGVDTINQGFDDGFPSKANEGAAYNGEQYVAMHVLTIED